MTTNEQQAPLAPKDSPYLFDLSKTNLPIDEVFDRYLPVPREQCGNSVPISDTKEEGYSSIFQNSFSPGNVKEALAKEFLTVHSSISTMLKYHLDKQCLGVRKYDHDYHTLADEYSYITYREMNEQKINLGSGLLYLLQHNPFKDSSKYRSHEKIDRHHLDFDKYDEKDLSFILTIFGPNRPEWVISDVMCASFSITNTALYDTLGPDSSLFILSETESPVVVASKNHIHSLIDLKAKNPEQLGNLISIVSMDPLNLKTNAADQTLVNLARKYNITLFDFEQVVHVGKMFPSLELPPRPENVFTISYTSGTSGSKPKGVVLTHKNAAGGILLLSMKNPKNKVKRGFSFLPLAHIFEREFVCLYLVHGYTVGYPRHGGTPLTLIDDLKRFKPTQMANVPRILTKFESALKSATFKAKSPIVSKLYTHIINSKIEWQSEYDGATGNHAFYDKVFISKLRKGLGFDNMETLITGSAPISPSTIKFLRAALNIGIMQGYGLTESFAGFCASNPLDKDPGSCGPTYPTTEIRVKEIPEMGYTANDPQGARGELLLRGPQIFRGYFNNEEETSKALDSDGWFHTGDIALISKDHGRLYIIDRVKSFFKLAQGEYITPEKVENQYLSNNPILTQCYVYGNSLHHYLVAVIGVDVHGIKKFLVSHCGLKHEAVSKLSGELVLEILIKKENRVKLIQYLNKHVPHLQGFERIQNVYIEFEPLTADRQLLTPTTKIKRPFCAKFFKSQLENMYEEGPIGHRSRI